MPFVDVLSELWRGRGGRHRRAAADNDRHAAGGCSCVSGYPLHVCGCSHPRCRPHQVDGVWPMLLRLSFYQSVSRNLSVSCDLVVVDRACKGQRASTTLVISPGITTHQHLPLLYRLTLVFRLNSEFILLKCMQHHLDKCCQQCLFNIGAISQTAQSVFADPNSGLLFANFSPSRHLSSKPGRIILETPPQEVAESMSTHEAHCHRHAKWTVPGWRHCRSHWTIGLGSA